MDTQTKEQTRERFVHWHWQALGGRRTGLGEGELPTRLLIWALVWGVATWLTAIARQHHHPVLVSLCVGWEILALCSISTLLPKWGVRCWWHFRRRRTVSLEGHVGDCRLHVGFDFDDEDITFKLAVPGVEVYLSFTTAWGWVRAVLPTKQLSERYPETMVVDERECEVSVHGDQLWVHLWTRKGEWRAVDPWWVRGVSVRVNPFEAVFIRSDVQGKYGNWIQTGGRGKGPWPGDDEALVGTHTYTHTYTYTYTRKSGEVQMRTATVTVERREWRYWCLQWTRWGARVHTGIDVRFDDEVGEETGSWKGGCVGCGYEMRQGETAEQCLRRMERERRF